MRISVDGGGVFSDYHLPEADRFRLSLTGNPSEDMTVYVEGGRLHVVGQYATVHAERIEPNHVTLHTVRPVTPR